MAVRPDSKYALQDLYAEIDLFDRKIAHSQQHASFDSEQERVSTIGKLVSKREALVKAAIAMASRGVECDPKYLPRSFKETGVKAAA
jgi:hypothetical protein